MATLTGKLISNTYKDLLQVSNSNDGVDSTVRFVSDGEGTNSALKISNSEVETTGKLTVGANISASGNITGNSATIIGNVTAARYYGDGSNLTGISAAAATSVTSFTTNNLTVVSGAVFSGKVSGTAAEFSGVVSASVFAGTAATFSANVTAAAYYGDGSNLTNLSVTPTTSVSSFTANQLTVVSGAAFNGKVSGTTAEFSGIVSAAGANFSGNVTAAAYYGDGSNLSNLPSAPTSVSAFTINTLSVVSGATFGGKIAGTTAIFSGNVSAAAYFGDGSNLTGITASAPTSVASFTTNQLTVVSGAAFTGKVSGTAAEFSGNVSAAAYFGDGSNLTGIGGNVTSVTSFTANQLTVVSGAAFTGKVSGTAAEFSGIVSAGTFAGASGIFTGKVSGTTLAMTGAVSASTFSGVGATFSGNVTAASYFGDGSNLTGVEASAATSVAAFTANQLTVVSGATFTGKVSGTAAEFSGNVSAANVFAATNIFIGGAAIPSASALAAVSALTSVNAAAITSVNTRVTNTSSALATSIGNSNTNIAAVSVLTSVNLAAITSINSILGDGSNFATSAELAAVSSALATSIGNTNTRVANTSSALATSIGNSNTNIAAVSALTSVNLAAITSVNTRVANTSSALATSIGNSNTNIAAVSVLTSVNKAAITSINSILGDGSNFATSAELAAVSSALATSIGNSNTNIAAVSVLTSVNLARIANTSSALATSIGNSNTNIAAVSVLTSVNLAAITSINSAALLKASNLSDLSNASTSRTNLGVAIGSDVEAFNADILKADEADELTAGFSAAAHSAGTKSSGTYTPDVDDGNFQFATNGGAHTLAVPAKNCTMVILYKNNASAGTITTSGYTVTDGDTITTTNGHEFFFYITRINDGSTTFSMLTVKALQ